MVDTHLHLQQLLGTPLLAAPHPDAPLLSFLNNLQSGGGAAGIAATSKGGARGTWTRFSIISGISANAESNGELSTLILKTHDSS